MKRIFIDILSGLWVRWKILLGWLAIWFEPMSVGNGRGSTPLSSSNLINIHEGHMAKITLNPITGSYASVTSMNDRFQLIEDAFNNNVLWRLDVAGGTNNMQNLLDMNSQQIINLPAPSNNNNAARLQDILDVASSDLTVRTAALTSITDGGGYFSSSNVEGSLQELGLAESKLILTTNGNGASLLGIEDAAGKYSGATVETALTELNPLIGLTTPQTGLEKQKQYSARISSGGSYTAPTSITGITVAKVGTGSYEITHNFGHTNYSLMVSSNASGLSCNTIALTNNSIFVDTFVPSTITAADASFSFILTEFQ